MKTPIFFKEISILMREREGKLLEYKIEVNKAQTTALKIKESNHRQTKIGEKERPKKWIIQ